jgi:hydroxymethylpyrimidine pyrophosphatase-like HAD family hydrolase|tara:strand:+ start:1182 stop:1550 length:369 start_codon:yes stop_codon:yes gene_type:complete
MSRPKTIFCDLDGTLTEHPASSQDISKYNLKQEMRVLPGTREKLWEWDKKGYFIILTTGRKEGMRKSTVEQLRKAGIIYDQLIMGFGGGDRILINDRKPDSSRDTAFAINLDRDTGVADLDL